MKINKHNLRYNTLSTISYMLGFYILYFSIGLVAALGVGLVALGVYIGVQGGIALSKSEKEDSHQREN